MSMTLYLVFCKIHNPLWQILMLLCKFPLLLVAKIEHTIHGHTAHQQIISSLVRLPISTNDENYIKLVVKRSNLHL